MMYNDELIIPPLGPVQQVKERRNPDPEPTRRATRGHKKSPHPAGGRKTGADQSAKPKVGSDRSAAQQFADEKDFGIPVDQASAANDFPGGRAKGPQQGTGPTRSGEGGVRTVGVGAPEGPDGSGSGGDLDTDIVGVGGSGGLAQSPPDQTGGRQKGGGAPPRADAGASARFASGGPAKGENADQRLPQRGTTISGEISGSEDAASTSGGQEELRDIHGTDRTIDPQAGGPSRANLNRRTRH